MSQSIVDHNDASKFTLCVLRTQIGKTFTTIDKILTEINNDDESGRSIHMVFTMNTLLSNRQFSKRLDSIEQEYGFGSVVVFASGYNGAYTHIKNRQALQGLCFDERTCPRVVVMCSNSVRYEDAVEFTRILDRNNHPQANIRRAYCYYDELHAYITDKLREQIIEVHSMDIVKGITALTATPEKILQNAGFWSRLRQIDLNEYNDKNYVGCDDMQFTTDDDFFAAYARPSADALDAECIGFVEHTINTNPSILSEEDGSVIGKRVFIPAQNRISSHCAIRELIFRLCPRAVVVILNSKEKTLQYRDQKTNSMITQLLSSSKQEEVSETIARIYKETDLTSRPLVITGFVCVGMGQTLSHHSTGSFTSAIFSHLNLSNDEIYQLFGRITGRMKEWDTYTKTRVYCPTKIMMRCKAMEECARNIANSHNGEIVSLDDYHAPLLNMGEIGEAVIENIRKRKEKSTKIHKEDTDKDCKMCDNIEDAIAFVYEYFGHRMNKRTDIAPKELLVEGGNPSEEYLMKRMWGLNKKSKFRVCPTNDNKWCIYWRPSLLIETEDNI